MDALLDAVRTFFTTVLAWLALPPIWTHSALHRSVGAYIRHAPSTLPFPFDIIFGGWEGLPDADVCSRLTSFSAYSLAHMPRPAASPQQRASRRCTATYIGLQSLLGLDSPVAPVCVRWDGRRELGGSPPSSKMRRSALDARK